MTLAIVTRVAGASFVYEQPNSIKGGGLNVNSLL